MSPWQSHHATPEEILSAGNIPVRELSNPANAPTAYSVAIKDRSTCLYEDIQGEIRFYFDFDIPPGPISLSITPEAPLVRDSRDEIASQRVANYLRNMGYKVMIFDPTRVDWLAHETACERSRATLQADGLLTMRSIPTQQAPCPPSRLPG